MTEPNEPLAEMSDSPAGAGSVTIADAAVRLGVSIPRLRRLLARPEWAYHARQIQRETKTGTRTSTVLLESLLPQLQDAFSREQQQQLTRADGAGYADSGGNEMVHAPASSGLSPLVDALLREKDSRIAELQRHIADLLNDKEQLYRALTRAQVANVLPPPEQREALPAPEPSPAAADAVLMAAAEPSASWETPPVVEEPATPVMEPITEPVAVVAEPAESDAELPQAPVMQDAETVAASLTAAASEPVFWTDSQEQMAEEQGAAEPEAAPETVLPHWLAEEHRVEAEPVPEPPPTLAENAQHPESEVLSAEWQPHSAPMAAAVEQSTAPTEAPAAPPVEEGGQKQSFWARFRAAHPRLTESPPVTPPRPETPERKEEPMPITPDPKLAVQETIAAHQEMPAMNETPAPESEEMPLFAFSNPTEVKMPRWLEEELAEKQRVEGLKTPATWNHMTLMSPEAVAEAAAQRAVYTEPEPLSLTAQREEASQTPSARKRGTWDKLSEWIKD